MTAKRGLPLYLELTGALCVCIGGGPVAARRVRKVLAAGARVRLVAPNIQPEIAALVQEGVLELVQRPYEAGDVAGARLVIVATDSPMVDAQVAREALAAGALTVVASEPNLGNCHFMASVERGVLEVAVHTHGLSPAVSASVRRRVERLLPAQLDAGLFALGELRQTLMERVTDPKERQRRWRQAVDEGAIERLLDGDVDQALAMLQEILLGE